jgi:hypothetical protein
LPAEAHYEFSAVGVDEAGNRGTPFAQARAGRDDSSPAVAASAGDYWHRGAIDLVLAAHDSLGLDRVTVRWRSSPDNATWGSWASHLDVNPGGKTWSANSSFTPATEAYFEFELVATDRSGKTATTVVPAAHDHTPPRTGLGGLGNHTGSPAFGIAATVDERLSGLDSMDLWYRKDGASWIRYATFPDPTVSFDSRSAGGDGAYEFRSTGTDNAGNAEAKTSIDIKTVVDTRAPHVSARDPSPDQSGVPVDARVKITFDEMVRPSGELIIRKGATVVPAAATWSADGSTVEVTPDSLLEPETEFTMTATDVEDLAGNRLASLTWRFTTGPVPPKVLTTSPLNGTAVPLGATEVLFSFSAPMAPAAAQGVQTDRGIVLTSSVAGASLRVVVEFSSPGPATITLLASKAASTAGMMLDGDGDGAPGGDFVLHLVAIPGSGSLRVEVRSSLGGPIDGATVTLEKSGNLVVANRSQPDGTAVLGGLEPGSYVLRVSAADHRPSSVQVAIESGKETRIEVSLVSESDLVARFPAGAGGLAALVAAGALLVVVGLLLLRIRRKGKVSRGATPAATREREEESGSEARTVEPEPEPVAPAAQKAVRRPKRKEVERDAEGEPDPEDVEMETKVVDAGTAALGAKRVEFGCPVCGHLVRAAEDECPGCGAEVKW